MGHSRGWYLPRISGVQSNLEGVLSVSNFAENVRGVIYHYLGIGVSKGCDDVFHHQYVFKCPRADDVLYNSVHKVQPPCSQHVVCEYDVILMEGSES